MYSIKKILIVTQLVLFILASVFSAQTAGEVDPAFNPRLVDVDYVFLSESIERTSVRRVVVQPDGKIIAAGLFNVVNDSVRDNIVRFNADGTFDTSFNPPALARFSGNELLIITALALQTDGKILIGGNFTTTGAVKRTSLARLNADGSLDSTFNANQTGTGLNGTVFDIEISADGKITACGYIGAVGQDWVVRLLPEGSVDTSFSPQINTTSSTGAYDVFVQPDGKTLVSVYYSSTSSNTTIYRLNTDGSVDFSHVITGNSRSVNRMVVQPDGKILVGGSFNMIDGFPIQQGLLRLNSNGIYDTTFNFGNSGASGTVTDIELLANGKILIGGWLGAYNGVERQYVALLNSDDGSLDNSFNYTPGRVLGVYDLAVQADGKIVVGTYSDFSQGVLVPPIARLNADATLDNSIQPFMGSAGLVHKVLVQPDGQILVSGFYNHINSEFRRNIGRFNVDGTYDSSLTGHIFFSNLTNYVAELDLQPDGKILAAGYISNGLRLNTNGTQDVELSNSPNPPSIRYLPNGKLLHVGGTIKRYSSQGFFESQTVRLDGGVAYKAAIQPDGKIIVVGSFTQINLTTPRNRIARLNADCTFDDTFNSPGANSTINNIALQPDGKFIIGGLFTSVSNNSNYKYLARLNADGSLDTSFNPVLNAQVTSFKLQPDGKILVGGAFTLVNGASRNSLVRFNQNGTLDASFNLGSGTDGLIRSIDLQADSKIIIGGEFRRVNGAERFGVARLLNSAVPQQRLFDYDGDGRADVSVFRPSTNRWYEFLSGSSTVSEQTFGISGDIIAPADFDGDGKTDIAIFRPASGDWWYLSSTGNVQTQTHWGQSGDIPRPSDFDGDGKADFTVFRPAENNWYRFGSTGQISIVNFGLADDKPVTGDFDGDGKSDVAIYRPSTGTWWYRSSINNAQIATRWGISTDIPAPADYDGDGKTDFAVYRPSTGVWYIINSSNGTFTIVHFGLAEDKPVAADYDGDGKADVAVFRPSTGVWYQLRSTQGFFAQQFGVSSDIPTPNSFVP